MEAVVAHLAKFMPNIDKFLAYFVDGTSLLQGGAIDYYLAALIALCFPLVRFILDRTIFDVRFFNFDLSPTLFASLNRINNRAVAGPQIPWFPGIQEE